MSNNAEQLTPSDDFSLLNTKSVSHSFDQPVDEQPEHPKPSRGRRENNELRDKIFHNVVTPSQWSLSTEMRLLHSSLALLLVVGLSPILLIIALAIKLDSRGPVFFKQQRTGYMGRRFVLYKFRTMVENADQLKHTVMHLNKHGEDSCDFKADNDPRITRVGRILRKTSLDELANLISVLKGDLRLVGPRPTSFCASTYDCATHMRRLSVYPGITGLWQISGRSNIGFKERVQLDAFYAENASPWLDFKIMLKTPLKVLKCDGAS